MDTEPVDAASLVEERGSHLVRLLQLASPSLPVGGFSYSQGLETAVEYGWVRGADDFRDWVESLMRDCLVYLEVPVLVRLTEAAIRSDGNAFARWADFLVASRETHELREEEAARGRAMVQVLSALSIDVATDFQGAVRRSQLAGLAWAARHWRLPVGPLCEAFAFSWLENVVMAGIKLVPLGQSDGQCLMAALGATIPAHVAEALTLADHDLGASSPAQAIASSLHETQYTRLFRS